MKKVIVHLAQRSYPILIGMPLHEAGRCLARLSFSRKTLVVTDTHVARLYALPLTASLRKAGFVPHRLVLPAGERYKTLAAVEKIYRAALDAGLDRRSPIVALGGGVVGDLAGFAAATYLRGLPFVQVPTTLLAMVDSSVGGKTGCDLPGGKNLVGAFYQPKAVLIDAAALETLPLRETRGGLAEVIKYGVIADEGFFSALEKMSARGKYDFGTIVQRCCRIKAGVVEKDEREEKGVREVLNFGHTFGHALETLTGYRVFRHGEAVAIGMVLAGQLAVRLGIFPQEGQQRLNRLILRTGLPAALPKGIAPERMLTVMLRDKKVREGKLRLVLPEKIGRVVVRPVEAGIIKEVLR